MSHRLLSCSHPPQVLKAGAGAPEPPPSGTPEWVSLWACPAQLRSLGKS
eukprot:CAMPEP_0185557900 /NCGR_PEP_ID=MMETSP1381-20130426/50907_1 /TAXON_ID=298111 /ORGANISM="Pavlova sp., Strain CCMP459" /LENGTH=48 /DNA_ID= /DNA_START= /DNA_END= /DNA_ORIENTATION=